MHSWQLQKAKAHLSELLRRATAEGPQEISVRGEPTVVVLSQDDYRRLTEPHPGLAEFLRTSPLAGLDLKLDRDKSMGRDVSL